MASDARESAIVVGAGPLVQSCSAALRARGVGDVNAITLPRIDGSGFQLDPLAEYPADHWRAFAAVGHDLLNLLRLGLMADLRSKGYRLTSIVSSRALVPENWKPGENTFVDDGAIIAAGSTVRYNAIIGARSIIGTETRIGHSVWIGAGAIIGAGVTIGDGTTIGAGAIVADGTEIGRQCELLIVREYAGKVADKTFCSAMFEGEVRIYGR